MLHRLLAVALLCTLAFGQGDRGTLTGAVSDPQGAVIPEAKISVRNTQTGSVHETSTTATGNYTLAQLPAGAYELNVEVAGFKKFTQQGLLIGVAQTARIDIVMQVGATSESVTVSADAPLLKTESAEQSYNIATERMNALPLNFGARGPGSFRNPFTFVVLVPGANITGRNDIRVNGQPNVTFGIRIEGQDAGRPLDPNNSDMVAPSVEAVQEIAVQTSNFAAEYGQVAGGLFNFTTKSGSNDIHGSLYGYFVNEALHAGRPFTDDGNGEHARPKDRKQDSGGSIGGPIYIPKVYDGRNKSFFFFNIEKYTNRGAFAGNLSTVPTPALRNGDFTLPLATSTRPVLFTDALGNPVREAMIFDPQTTQTLANGTRVRTMFPNNSIPVSRFDPVSAKIQNFFPAAEFDRLVQNWSPYATTVRKNEITSFKIDHNFDEKSKLNFYFHYYRTKFGNNGADGLSAPITAKRLGSARTPTLRINYNYSIAPTMMLLLGAGFVREHVPDKAVPGVDDFDQATIGLTGAVGPGFPRITGLSTGAFGGMGLNIGPTNANDYYAVKPTAIASLTWVRNNHTFKFGGDWRIDAFTNRNALNTYGAYAFNNTVTGHPQAQGLALPATPGHNYASFLLGGPGGATIANEQDPQYRKYAVAFFVQDTWKVTRRLTLDYGLRWDYQSAMRELWDRTSMFDPYRQNPSAGNLLGATSYEGYGQGRCECTFAKTYPYAFGPRVGAAYQIDSKTVFRAGIGVTYGQTANFNYIGTTVGTGFNTLNINSTTYAEPAMWLRDGLKYDQNLLYAASLNPGIRPSPGQTDSPSGWIDPDGGRPSRITQWSIGFQREITRDLVVDANYVGNRGAWFQSNSLVELNALTPERLASFGLDIKNAADRAVITSQISSTTARNRGFGNPPYAGFPANGTVAQSLRPYPQFGNLGVRWAPLGNNWYDSLQVKATKRYSYGLDFTLAFTWQKELIRGSENQGGGGGAINDVFNRPNQKGISNQSQPLVTVIGTNYMTPAMGSDKWVRGLVGGWTISAILRYSSGTPIGVPGSVTSNLNALLFRGTRMNRVSGQPLFLKDLNCNCIDPYKDLVYNPAAWQDVAAGEWGFSAPYYNDYRFQRRPDEQLSFGRTFKLDVIREGTTLHFRGEFFNAFNRMQLPNPGGNPNTATTTDARGLTGGFGFINPQNAGTPRNGQIVLRLQF